MTVFRAKAGERALRLLEAGILLSVLSVHEGSLYAADDEGRLLLFHSDAVAPTPFGVMIEDYGGFVGYLRPEPGLVHRISREGGLTARGRDVSSLHLIWMPLKYRRPARSEYSTCELLSGIEHVRDFLSMYERENCTFAFSSLLDMLKGINVASLPNVDHYHKAMVSGFNHMFCMIREANHGTDLDSLFDECLLKLIGLGHGLTPSADDILCGMIYSLSYFLVSDTGIFQALRNGILALRDKTTAVSGAYLEAAANAWSFPLWDEVLDRMRMNSGEELETAMIKLSNIGSSSGANWLLGLAIGAQLAVEIKIGGTL